MRQVITPKPRALQLLLTRVEQHTDPAGNTFIAPTDVRAALARMRPEALVDMILDLNERADDLEDQIREWDRNGYPANLG